MSKTTDLVAELLEKLGAEDDIVAAIKKDDDAAVKDLKAEDIANSVIETQKGILAENEDFKAPIERDVRGALLNSKMKVLSDQFPKILTKEVIAGLPKGKEFDEAIKLVARETKKEKAPEGNKELQDEIEKLNQELVKKDEKIADLEENEIPKVRTEAEQKLLMKDLNIAMRSEFDKVAGSKLITEADLIYPDTLKRLNDKFDVKYENGTAVLYEKGKQTKATKNSKPLTIGAAFDEINTENKRYKLSDPRPPKDAIPQPGDKDVTKLSPQQRRFKEQVDAKKKEIEANTA